MKQGGAQGVRDRKLSMEGLMISLIWGEPHGDEERTGCFTLGGDGGQTRLFKINVVNCKLSLGVLEKVKIKQTMGEEGSPFGRQGGDDSANHAPGDVSLAQWRGVLRICINSGILVRGHSETARGEIFVKTRI